MPLLNENTKNIIKYIVSEKNIIGSPNMNQSDVIGNHNEKRIKSNINISEQAKKPIKALAFNNNLTLTKSKSSMHINVPYKSPEIKPRKSVRIIRNQPSKSIVIPNGDEILPSLKNVSTTLVFDKTPMQKRESTELRNSYVYDKRDKPMINGQPVKRTIYNKLKGNQNVDMKILGNIKDLMKISQET